MSKSNKTLELERAIWKKTHKLGVFGCFEVTIGWNGKERADYVTYEKNGIWRFYEIKASKTDFYSKANHSFYGHYNYYIMPYKLFKEVESVIPSNIGVTDGCNIFKRAKKMDLAIDSEKLKDYFIRSLQRDYAKDRDSRDESTLGEFKRLYEFERKRSLQLNKRLLELSAAVREKYGSRELRELINNESSKGSDGKEEKSPCCPLRWKNGKCLAYSGDCKSISEIDCEIVRRAYEIGKADDLRNE